MDRVLHALATAGQVRLDEGVDARRVCVRAARPPVPVQRLHREILGSGGPAASIGECLTDPASDLQCDVGYGAVVNLRRHWLALASLLMLVPVAAAVPAVARPAAEAPPAAAKAPAYDATIEITEHGIPHITSDTFEGMAYGAGWATTAAATCNLMDTLLTARGLRSQYLGPDARLADGVGGNGTNLRLGHPGHRPARPPGRRERCSPTRSPARATAPRRWSSPRPPASTSG